MRKRSQYWEVPGHAPEHPYVRYEGSAAWESLKQALIELDRNQDIDLTEWHQYVVGYLCEQLERDGVLRDEQLTPGTQVRQGISAPWAVTWTARRRAPIHSVETQSMET